MQFKFLVILVLVFFLSACGQGSSSSGEKRSKSNNFDGKQSITLTNGESEATEEDDFVATLEGNIVTIIDENFNAKGELNSQNQFVVSSPMFSTSSAEVTCTGNVVYTGSINGANIIGEIKGEFICSEIVFDVTGSFSATN